MTKAGFCSTVTSASGSPVTTDDITVAAYGDRADIRGAPQRLGRRHPGRLQGLQRCHSPRHHRRELLGIVAVRVDTAVGAEDHPDTGPGRRPERLPLQASYSFLLLAMATVTATNQVVALFLTPYAVPLPPSAWLFSSAMLGLLGLSRRRRTD
jgi:hypothetical protein